MSQANILIYFILSFISIYTFASPVKKLAIPYEKCSWDSHGFTNRLVRESQDFTSRKTEARALCIDCNKKISYQNKTNQYLLSTISSAINQANDIPEICFLAGALSQIAKQPTKYSNKWHYCLGASSNEIRKKMYFTGKNCSRENYESCLLDEPSLKNPLDRTNQEIKWQKQPWSFAQRPCLNKDYIGMTAKAFNETANCFGFSNKKDKEKLFAFMNNQSSFLLNKKPASNKARSCYGQVSAKQITSANAYIQYPKIYPKYHKIYQDAIDKCPHLSTKANLISSCASRKNSSVHNYRKCLSKTTHSDALMCQTSQDAYSCLFYSLFTFKKYQNNINKIFEQVQDPAINLKSDKNKELSKLFKWPVKFNEVLTVKGDFKGTIPAFTDNVFLNSLNRKSLMTKELEVSAVYKSSSPIIKTLNQHGLQYDKTKLKVHKVQVFDKYQLKWFFMHLAKKEGKVVINQHLPGFMKYMKDKILEKEDYKKLILKGRSLHSSVLISEFNQYAKENKLKMQEEPAKLAHNINQKLKILGTRENLTKGIKHIYKNQDFNRADIAAFKDLIKQHCPNGI